MPWFICRYVVPNAGPFAGNPRARMCAMNRHTGPIRADGGDWREVEVLGNRAIVKVQASPATLTAITSDLDCRRLPLDLLDRPLSGLTNAQRTALQNELLDMGYPLSEIRDRLGNNLSLVTLRQVLRFAATRRRKPRWDAGTSTVVFDGPMQLCESVDALDILVGP